MRKLSLREVNHPLVWTRQHSYKEQVQTVHVWFTRGEGRDGESQRLPPILQKAAGWQASPRSRALPVPISREPQVLARLVWAVTPWLIPSSLPNTSPTTSMRYCVKTNRPRGPPEGHTPYVLTPEPVAWHLFGDKSKFPLPLEWFRVQER